MNFFIVAYAKFLERLTLVKALSIDSLADNWAKTLNVDRKHFNLFFDKMIDAFAYHKIVVDKSGKPIDYIFLEVNSAFEQLTGLKRTKPHRKTCD